MNRTKASLAIYAALTIIGALQLALVLLGSLGLVFNTLLFVSGSLMLVITAYGVNKRLTISKLPIGARVGLILACGIAVCTAFLMGFIILALRNFQ